MKRASATTRPPLKSMLKVQRKQLIAIGFLFGAIVLLTGYIWYSMQQWNRVSAGTKQTNSEVKTRILALQDKKHSLEEVQVETEVITEKIDGMCEVSPVVSWQRQVAPKIRDTLESCATYQKSLGKARDALETLTARTVSEQQFANLLTTQRKKIITVAPGDIEANRDAWRGFAAEVKKVTTHVSLNNAKTSAHTTATELVAAYDALITANKEENRAAYDEAVGSIQKSYSKLGEIQNLSVESYSRLVDEVRKTSQAL